MVRWCLKKAGGLWVSSTNCKSSYQTPHVSWSFSKQGWHCEWAARMSTHKDSQDAGDTQLWLWGGEDPPVTEARYTALCTWHILGEFGCRLLLCHGAAILGFWETSHGAPPFTGPSLLRSSSCCAVAKVCWHRVNFVPTFCWLYSKMHNKTLKIFFKVAWGQMATCNQLLKMRNY